ncbi:MAG: isochorismatase family protein [Holophagaceae bacterium]|uniref:Isochorismatase family protein n=1 Tax=Candidatus Geothrix skivensis TaxID=2954439 RepID=A0A9D7SKA0_9BACT|nr:isochorismatase family protein [Candidatus Geothrix skivensis]
MPLLDSSRSILVLIDFQGKLVHMVHRPAPVLEAARRLLRLADLFSVPVVLTEQYPKGIGPTEESLRSIYDGLSTPKFFLEKTAFGCCGDGDFELLLQQARPMLRPPQRQIVVAGIEAHVCVLQTVLELLASGHKVHLCWDAVSGRGEEYCRHALERMAAAGATLTNHESVAFEWARDKNHPQFKALSALMKEGQPQG